MKIYAALSFTLLSTANAAFSISSSGAATTSTSSTVTVTGLHGKPASSHEEDLALTISLSLAHFSALDAAMTEELTEEIETVLKTAKETVEKCERIIQSIEEDMIVVEEPTVVVSDVSEEMADESEEILIVAVDEETTNVAVAEDEDVPVVEDVVSEAEAEAEAEETEPVIVVPVPEPASASLPPVSEPLSEPVSEPVATNAPKMEVKPRTRRHVQIQSAPKSKESKKMRLFSISGQSSSSSPSSSTKINSVVKVSPGYSYVSAPTYYEKDYNSKTGKAMAGMTRFVKLFSAFGLRR